MTTFIFFHGIAINTANMLSGEIWRDTNDATKSRLYITTENAGEQHQLEVDYDTARKEWAEVWVVIAGVPLTLKTCDRGASEGRFWRDYPLSEVDVNGKAVK